MSSSVAVNRVGSLLSQFGISELAFDDALAALNPLWTVHRPNARVIQRIAETPTSCSLVLQAGAAFTGMASGQYVVLGVEIDGVIHRRAYSPRWVDRRKRLFAVTVQRQPHGLVSNWLNDHAATGDVLEISQAAGQFVLPEAKGQAASSHVLMIAGGSGITPCRAMLDELQQRAPTTRITLLYFARSRQDRIFAADLERIAARWANLRYLPIDSVANTTAQSGRGQEPMPLLTRELLDQTMPNWAGVPAYCCGPAPLMEAARQLWREANASERLNLESFGSNKPAVPGSAEAMERHQVSLHRNFKDHAFTADPSQSLLQAGESAGLSLPHGCRQGICHECSCKLDSGTVVDLVTGERHQGEGQYIRICVSAALSDVSLDAEP